MKNNGVFTEYPITGKFIDRVYGGLPANPDIIETFLMVKGVEAENVADAEAMIKASQNANTVNGATDNRTNIFARDEKGIYLNAYQIMGAVKEAMSMRKSVSNWRNKMARGMRVTPARIYLQKKGKNVMDADGTEQHVVHKEYMGKPISALSKCEYLEGVEFSCTVHFVNEKTKEGVKPIVSKDELAALMGVISLTGIGSNRAMGAGMAEITLGA